MIKKVFFIAFLFFLFALAFPLPVRAQVSLDYDVGPNLEDYVWPHSQHRWRTIITNGTSVSVSGRLNATYEAAKYSSPINPGGWVDEGGRLRYDYSLSAFSSKTIDWFGTLVGSDSECRRINDVKSDFYHNGSLVKTEIGTVLANVYLTLRNQTVDSITVSTYVNGVFNDTRSLSPGGSSGFRITAGGLDGGGSLFSCSRPFSYSFTVTGVAGATYSCSAQSTALTNNCTSEHTATCTKTTGPTAGPTPTLAPGQPSNTPAPTGTTACPYWCQNAGSPCPAGCTTESGACDNGGPCCKCPATPIPTSDSGSFDVTVPESICIEDGAWLKVRQHQDIKYDWIDVNIDKPGFPFRFTVCRAGDFSKPGGDRSCFWDTMHIENAEDYDPDDLPTGPYPAGAYVVSVLYPGAGKNPRKEVFKNTNLIHCPPSCSGLTTSSGTIVYGNSVTLTANISNYGLIYGGRCPDSNPACRAVQTTPAFQRIQYGGPSFSTTYTPSTSTGGGGKYVFEVTAYDSTACKYACTAGQIYYRENTGLGNCTASGVWTNIGSCTSTGCLKYVTVNTPTLTPVPPIPTPTFIPTPTPRPQVSWFQTTGGDIQSQGDITSIIPDCAASEYLSKRGEGGSPGVVGYYDSLSIGTVGEVSETRWQAKTRYNGGDMKFDYLKKRLKVDTTKVLPGSDIPTVSGTYYLDSEMSLNLNGGAIPNGRKIVIFVTSNVTVTGNITVASGGFFALISRGNITFDDTVTQADGFYLSNEAITVAEGISPFSGQGSFIGWEGISFLRDLIDNCNPAEAFIERPDFYINAPDSFKLTNSYFKEIEP